MAAGSFRIKFLLLLVVIAALFWWLAPRVLNGLGSVLSPTYVVVDEATAVHGTIASHSANRGKYRFMLAGRQRVFDFDNFENQALWEGGCLGSYLLDGDEVAKLAQATTLRITRRGQVSAWMLKP